MTWFSRWLRSFLLLFSVGALSLGCQVLFGDFKVGDGVQPGASGNGSAASGNGSAASGGSSAQGGAAGSAQSSGPLMVFPSSGLYTSDLGAQTKFYVSLTQKPSAPVTLPITSSNQADGSVSPTSLSFTADDWNAPQAVTVTGEHDLRFGNQAYFVDVGPATSEDAAFEGAKASVPITNIDNDGAGFFVNPSTGLVTTESGGHATFTVVLNSAPAAPVVVTLSSSDDSIGTVSPSSLTFTVDNWKAPQVVTLTGTDDEVAAGDRPYQITVGPLLSTDSSYANLPSQTVSVTNQDNDVAGVTVTLATGIDPGDTTRLRTSEAGESASFKVVLNKMPKSDVVIAIASNSSEGTVNTPSLTFTKLNWDAPQTVTVTGVDNDTTADGNQPYQITLGPITSADPAYGMLKTADLPYVNVVNVDNDQAGFAVSLLTGRDPNDASQLLTSEKRTTASFSIVLTSKPSGTVQFGLTSSNDKEGTVSPAQLEFTTGNWNVAQTVTVTGVDDDAKDGNVVYAVHIAAPTTEDLAYQKLLAQDVKVVNLDDDVAGITPPKLLSGIDGGTNLITTERPPGGTASFSVSLTSRPKSDVTLPVASSDTTEGKVSPATLTFTPANYATAQIVTVTGQNDDIVDGNQVYTVTVGASQSQDADYVGLSQSVKVTNQDDDSAYIVVDPPNASGTTQEDGTTASFGLSLHSQPTASVTLTITSSDTKEGTVSPGTLTFSTVNWSTPQNITVKGVDDDVADGNKAYTVLVKGSGQDPNYATASNTLSLTNKDDDAVGFKVTPVAGLQTTEAGGKATFTVALKSQPTGNVSLSLTSSNTAEGTVSPASLSFSAGNWSSAQTVTVTGVNDDIADVDQPYTVSIKAASSSADPKYVQLAASTVSLVNVNDDTVGIAVTS
ncbi:MAG: Calx-beta domain-containing protein, partial [Polyangiaceae bacterium]